MMLGFAERTGLSSDEPERRYLWTDAFAVCNLLGLARATGEPRHAELALTLVDRVHHTLGRHRPDDPRTGFLGGLGDEEGEAHPTRGGLRIGKKYPERGASEPFDSALEWERDGQYFHYLTKWMHALNLVALQTRIPTFHLWARELARTSARAFCYATGDGHRRGMYWKMSIDLSRPLVSSMGQHDPVDGYVTCAELRATSSTLPGAAPGPDLGDEMATFATLMRGHPLATVDPLGIGDLLAAAHRVDQLERQGASLGNLCNSLLEAALSGLEDHAPHAELGLRAEDRLAFRELGLCIGLDSVLLMASARPDGPELATSDSHRSALLEALGRYDWLRTRLISFWLAPANRSCALWADHQDINDVMLATALAPEGFLVLPS